MRLGNRDIVLQKWDLSLQRIYETCRSFDALQYPFIFWEGQDGYELTLKQVDSISDLFATKKVSALKFFSYIFMIREGEQHIFIYRLLFHQFVADMYVKVEPERLPYLRQHQTKLLDDYIHLRNAINNDRNVVFLERMVIIWTRRNDICFSL